jgi:hypothetical protein
MSNNDNDVEGGGVRRMKLIVPSMGDIVGEW